MLVYANNLLTVARPDAFARAIDAVGGWIESKTHKYVTRDKLVDGFAQRLRDGKEIACSTLASGDGDGKALACISLGHPDDDVPGRKWLTRVGIAQSAPGEGCFVSVVLETSDISAKAGMAHAFTTRPVVVRDIVGHCGLAAGEPRTTRQDLTADRLDAFAALVENPARDYALVLLTVDPFSERPLVDTDRLMDLLLGLAEVHLVANKRDTFPVAQTLGRSMAAWNGAIRIIYPPRGGSGFIYTELLTTANIVYHQKQGDQVEPYILHSITHRLNLPRSRREVTVADVSNAAMHRRMLALQKEAKDGRVEKDLLKLYEEENTRLLAENGNVKNENAGLFRQLEAAEADVDRLTRKCDGLQAHLNARHAATPVDEDTEVPAREFDSLAEVTQAVTTEMAQRIVLTNRAEKSMRDSPFKQPNQVYEAFCILDGLFHDLFIKKHGMDKVEKALKEAGLEYAPHMDEKTLGMFDDYTGQYKGRKADFHRHLKIGTSRNPERSFRIHFEWDEDDKKIAVHYAGKHPTNQKT